MRPPVPSHTQPAAPAAAANPPADSVPQRPDTLTVHYRSGDTLRSRSVGKAVLCGTLDVPAPTARLQADWQREIATRLALEPGDVEQLPLALARARWPDYRHCVQAVGAWMDALGLPDLLPASEVALMACRGARYHHDGAEYGGAAFCNLFLSEDKELDLHFPGLGLRIPLRRGTVVVFDTGQPHGVLARHSSGFYPAHFSDAQDLNQVFLTWELSLEHLQLAAALGIALDSVPAPAGADGQEQVCVNGAPARVCPRSGSWLPAEM